MKSEFENIEPENQEIYNLLKQVAEKEKFEKQIKNIVAQKIESTDFATLTGLSSTAATSFLGSGIYYLIGVIVVAGSLSYYYFTSKQTNIEQINSTQELLSENDVLNSTNSAIPEIKSLPEENVLAENIKPENKTEIKKSITNEEFTIETKEYQHIQTIKINEELNPEQIKTVFNQVFKNLGFSYTDRIKNNSIICETENYDGNFNNQSVKFKISLLYNDDVKGQIKAVLNYSYDNTNKNSDLDLNEIFYEILTDELIRLF